ncbi:flagellar basal body P-ring protein FlgI [Vogesella fluminis]|uniref:Flagellar P-ring protein n=1 Tax=Vogesella fluminis TaxID=1069161 RepID=A0ABQ3HB51_9NEIS|nr:flagellar basal body P-ring protein FlgI [Vogesella fluminis]GHD76221.1 flagellar P-ring protein [Vogesella fluminis]
MSRFIVMVCLALAAGPLFAAQKIKELASVAGVRSNPLIGYGLVVGLDGSGDKASAAPFTGQSLGNMLNQLGVQIPQGLKIDPKNVAAVSLTATLPPFARRGQALDITVSSLGDAKSLRGGTLLLSPLKGIDGQIYALAQGNVVVGGAGAAAGGSKAQINHLSVGRIPAGATVERELPASLGMGDMVALQLLESDFTTANRVVQAINRELGGQTARALDGRQIEVRAPQDSNARIQFLSRLENIAVEAAEVSPVVIINARTGSIVMNKAVRIDPCAIAHGNLSVTVNSTSTVSQPPPLSGGQTAVTRKADVSVSADGSKVVNIPGGASLSEVVGALNSVGATPQDLISILQAMKVSGSLKAELQII